MSKSQVRQKVDLPARIQDEIEKHAYSNLEAEVGGMLVGEIENDKTIITGVVPAVTAAAEQISLTFTHDVWEDILKTVDKKFPGKKIVGWYHTHPSFGLFLSQYDSFIQENFFANAGQLALVIDPIAGNLAWFELDKSKKIIKFGETATKTGPRQNRRTSGEMNGGGANLRNLLITAIVVAIVSVAATWATTKLLSPTDQTAVVEQKNQEILALQGVLAMPVYAYTVAEGDSLLGVAERFYRNPDQAQWLGEINSGTIAVEGVLPAVDQVLPEGTVLLVPYVVDFSISGMVSSTFLPYSPPVVDPAPTSTPTPSDVPSSSTSIAPDDAATPS